MEDNDWGLDLDAITADLIGSAEAAVSSSAPPSAEAWQSGAQAVEADQSDKVAVAEELTGECLVGDILREIAPWWEKNKEKQTPHEAGQSGETGITVTTLDEDGNPIAKANTVELITSHTYHKRGPKGKKDWTEDELGRFYKGLSMFGTEMTMISDLLPGRSRHEVKLLFRREERNHPNRVQHALQKSKKISTSYVNKWKKMSEALRGPSEAVAETAEEPVVVEEDTPATATAETTEEGQGPPAQEDDFNFAFESSEWVTAGDEDEWNQSMETPATVID
eukprot:TRINITY_DN80012_c0_g1_i1.p1 TRINITY_DN80012_c0_g1~~TRINITY_DN80012_c0_g1_i1.p1  ORF type:complete len:279 (-),score=50.90 TRINITY_DN80012_c0_g1_i1:18-854(-)